MRSWQRVLRLVMGRNRKIDDAEALEAAMRVFWARGYLATTIDDLQSGMKLQRGSFYLRFPDKRSLFLEVLGYYRSRVVEPRRVLVREASNGALGIRHFFNAILDHSSENREIPGCLNTNTATESADFLKDDKVILDRLRGGFQDWENFWNETVKRAIKDGSLAHSRPSREIAKRLVVLTQGFNVIAKVTADRKALRGFINAGLSGITKI